MNKYLIFIQRALAILTWVALVIIIYLLWARPYQLRWGATAEEVQRAMPGDELNYNPNFLATRAILIDGTPDEIWPWLLQMGYGRAGFYGYDIFENLGSPRGMYSAENILPEFQRFGVGDEVPISPAGGLVFYAIEQAQYMVWSGEGWGGITWALYPVDQNHTRLVSRIRWSYNLVKPSQFAIDVFTEFTDHLAVRKIVQGVKGRVEGHIESVAQGNLEFAFFLASALILLWAVLLSLIYPFSWQRWFAGFGAGISWLIMWYAPFAPWSGLLVEVVALWYMNHVFRDPNDEDQTRLFLRLFMNNQAARSK